MLKKALISSLISCAALSLLATPALARPWHAKRGHGHGHHRYFSGHGGHHRGYVRGPVFYGYGGARHHHFVDHAFLWLGLTAIGIKALDVYDHERDRQLEAARWGAATGPIGVPVAWTTGPVTGTLTPVREGYGPAGEYCREFQKDVQIGGRTERAYGTACLQPDGSWRLIP